MSSSFLDHSSKYRPTKDVPSSSSASAPASSASKIKEKKIVGDSLFNDDDEEGVILFKRDAHSNCNGNKQSTASTAASGRNRGETAEEETAEVATTDLASQKRFAQLSQRGRPPAAASSELTRDYFGCVDGNIHTNKKGEEVEGARPSATATTAPKRAQPIPFLSTHRSSEKGKEGTTIRLPNLNTNLNVSKNLAIVKHKYRYQKMNKKNKNATLSAKACEKKQPQPLGRRMASVGHQDRRELKERKEEVEAEDGDLDTSSNDDDFNDDGCRTLRCLIYDEGPLLDRADPNSEAMRNFRKNFAGGIFTQSLSLKNYLRCPPSKITSVGTAANTIMHDLEIAYEKFLQKNLILSKACSSSCERKEGAASLLALETGSSNPSNQSKESQRLREFAGGIFTQDYTALLRRPTTTLFTPQ